MHDRAQLMDAADGADGIDASTRHLSRCRHNSAAARCRRLGQTDIYIEDPNGYIIAFGLPIQ